MKGSGRVRWVSALPRNHLGRAAWRSDPTCFPHSPSSKPVPKWNPLMVWGQDWLGPAPGSQAPGEQTEFFQQCWQHAGPESSSQPEEFGDFPGKATPSPKEEGVLGPNRGGEEMGWQHEKMGGAGREQLIPAQKSEQSVRMLKRQS